MLIVLACVVVVVLALALTGAFLYYMFSALRLDHRRQKAVDRMYYPKDQR